MSTTVERIRAYVTTLDRDNFPDRPPSQVPLKVRIGQLQTETENLRRIPNAKNAEQFCVKARWCWWDIWQGVIDSGPTEEQLTCLNSFIAWMRRGCRALRQLIASGSLDDPERERIRKYFRNDLARLYFATILRDSDTDHVADAMSEYFERDLTEDEIKEIGENLLD